MKEIIQLEAQHIRQIMKFAEVDKTSSVAIGDFFYQGFELSELALKDQFFNYRAIAYGQLNDDYSLNSLFYATVGDMETGLTNINVRCCFATENLQTFFSECVHQIEKEYADEYTGMKINLSDFSLREKRMIEGAGFSLELSFPARSIDERPVGSYKKQFVSA